LPRLRERYDVLDAGAALGHGVGPLVVRRVGGPATLAELAGRRVAIPGVHTTAAALLRAFAPPCIEVAMRFEAVVPAVVRGEVDAGVVIHEGRFTFAGLGLERVVDLGEAWEHDTGMPLPLGVIVARRDLPTTSVAAFDRALAASVAAAWADPSASRPWV